MAHQCFIHNGRELKDAQTLAECGIRDGTLLHMVIPHGPWVRVMPLFGAEMQVSSRRVESSSNTCAHELLRQNCQARAPEGERWWLGAPLCTVNLFVGAQRPCLACGRDQAKLGQWEGDGLRVIFFHGQVRYIPGATVGAFVFRRNVLREDAVPAPLMDLFREVQLHRLGVVLPGAPSLVPLPLDATLERCGVRSDDLLVLVDLANLWWGPLRAAWVGAVVRAVASTPHAGAAWPGGSGALV